MKDRIRLFIEKENKTSSQFAEEIGIQPSGVSHVLSGRNKPSLDFIIKMLTTYSELNTDWLLFGRGEMYRTESEPSLFAGSESDLHAADKSEYRDVSLFDDGQLQKDPAETGTNRQNNLNEGPGDSFSKVIIIFYPDGTYKEYKRRK
ncbi:MAG TPA: XRE family transcriptional regulator [Bacteroidetes bacterium]|nr:XRE family transcriptional regulator [Bacteroidota bacterium]